MAKITTEKLREVINIIEDGNSDGWDAWIELKEWLASYEAAQLICVQDEPGCHLWSLPSKASRWAQPFTPARDRTG